MSSSQLVDGKTGELIGTNYYTTGSNYVTTSNYVAAPVSSGYAPASSSYYYSGAEKVGAGTTQVVTTTTTTNQGNVQNIYPGGVWNQGATVISGGDKVSGGQVVNTTVNTGKDVIKGESRIEYVPFEKKIVEYKDQAKVERVPKKVKKV